MQDEKKATFTRKLRLRKETLQELTPADLANVRGGGCTCTTDFSNACCGPNGSCRPAY